MNDFKKKSNAQKPFCRQNFDNIGFLSPKKYRPVGTKPKGISTEFNGAKYVSQIYLNLIYKHILKNPDQVGFL